MKRKPGRPVSTVPSKRLSLWLPPDVHYMIRAKGKSKYIIELVRKDADNRSKSE